MSSDKYLALIGVSEQETAHLRLIMRKVAGELDHRWQFGEEGGADLLIIDPQSFAGQMARNRADGAGMRYAVFCDLPPEDGGLFLPRPLQVASVVALLNRAGGAFARPSGIGTSDAGFYVKDLGDSFTEAPVGRGADAVRDRAVRGLDEMLRPQPIELRGAPDISPQSFHAVPGANGMPGSVSPSTASRDAVRPRLRYTTRAAMLADTKPHGLRDYLEGDLLGGPARFTLKDAPALVLDPKMKVAYSPGRLGALEPYCRQQWRPCDWQPLMSAELAELRKARPALPYARLVWLDTLLHSGGKLATHLDPGGTYRLAHWVEIDLDLGRYFRVAATMLQPLRLHEIASASGAPMSDVFDVINAYDAVGLIEWQPRAPRDHGPAEPSLLDKLRRPFMP